MLPPFLLATGLLFWRAHDLRPLGPTWLLEWVRDLTAMGGFLQLKLYTIFAVVALFWLRCRREGVLLALTVLSASLVNVAFIYYLFRVHRREWLGGPGPLEIRPAGRSEDR